MANPEHVEIVRQGKAAIDRWRAENFMGELDLSGENLSLFLLKNADLRSANLRGTNLIKADLTNADLSHVKLGVDPDTKRSTSIAMAELRHANFSDASGFELVEDLEAKQLGGVNLKGVELPQSIDIKSLESLADVSSHVKYTRTLFLTLIATCIYSWLTMWSASDANIITNNKGLTLPIINVSLPVTAFFWVTPCILLAVYAYFLLYFQQLLERLSLAPAVFPDGKTLDEQADPWIILSFIRQHLTGVELREREKYQYWLIVFLVWWIVPITLVGFWQRYMVTNNLIPALWLILWCLVSIELSLYFYCLAISTMSGKDNLKKWSCLIGSLQFRWEFLNCFLSAIIHFIRKNVFKDREVLSVFSILLSLSLFTKIVFIPSFWQANFEYEKLGGVFLDKINLPEANLKGALLQGATLNESNLINASLPGVDLTEAKLIDADLTEADLRGANLTNADLTEVNLTNADLTKVNLTNADLTEADLRGANLTNADMTKAELRYATLDRANLSEANLSNANLSVAKLRDAKLIGADLNKARLVNTILDRANLSGANLKNANLNRTKFIEADLTKADLNEAFLWYANLTRARLPGANLTSSSLFKSNLRGADLSHAILIRTDLRLASLSDANLSSAILTEARVGSLSWVEDIRKLHPPVRNFDYKRWSVAERKNERGRTIYILVGPVEAKKPNLEN